MKCKAYRDHVNDLSIAGLLTYCVTVLKVGRVAIITRGRYAGKKVNFHHPNRSEIERESTSWVDGATIIGVADDSRNGSRLAGQECKE
jgi:hypothetical protein